MQHVPSGPTFTDVLDGPNRLVPFLHEPSEVGMDPRYADRSATGKYRTTPLRGLLQHAPYFHDGSAPDLLAVVNHYDTLFGLNLTPNQKADLVEYLKSL
jgi:cytochrome c peroxidase